MKYIITGASGYVGSNIVKELVKRGEEVYIILRDTSKLDLLMEVKSAINIYIYNGDLEQLISYFNSIKANIVIHTASLFISQHKSDDIDNLIDSNIKFGTEILEAMKLSGIKKFINTSTSWQHFNNEKYNPVCLYAATKEAFENIIKYYYEAFEIDCISLEIYDTFGKGDKRPKLLNQLIKFRKNGNILDMSPGMQSIDLVYIDDIVRGYIKASEILLKNANINVKYALSSENRVSLRDLVKLYEKVSGEKLVVNFGGREYREREVMEPYNKQEKLPGWRAEISLEDGLKKMLGQEAL